MTELLVNGRKGNDILEERLKKIIEQSKIPPKVMTAPVKDESRSPFVYYSSEIEGMVYYDWDDDHFWVPFDYEAGVQALKKRGFEMHIKSSTYCSLLGHYFMNSLTDKETYPKVERIMKKRIWLSTTIRWEKNHIIIGNDEARKPDTRFINPDLPVDKTVLAKDLGPQLCHAIFGSEYERLPEKLKTAHIRFSEETLPYAAQIEPLGLSLFSNPFTNAGSVGVRTRYKTQ